MSDDSDDMEAYSGLVDGDDEQDIDLRIQEVLLYCKPHLDKMWAAKVVSILLDCDFRECKDVLNEYFLDEYI